MKRDPDLIRKLMLRLEEAPASTVMQGSDLRDIEPDDARLVEHLQLLLDEDFIEGSNAGGWEVNAEAFIIQRITSSGHDFIDAIRDDTIWEKTKDKAAKVGGSVSLGTLTEIATSIVRAVLGLTA